MDEIIKNLDVKAFEIILKANIFNDTAIYHAAFRQLHALAGSYNPKSVPETVRAKINQIYSLVIEHFGPDPQLLTTIIKREINSYKFRYFPFEKPILHHLKDETVRIDYQYF